MEYLVAGEGISSLSIDKMNGGFLKIENADMNELVDCFRMQLSFY